MSEEERKILTITQAQLFLEGYAEMIKQLKPTQVLFWGNIPAELNSDIIVPMGYIMDEKFKSLREKK